MGRPPPGGYPPARTTPNSPLCIAALAVGIASILFFWGPFAGILIAVAGVIFGIMGMKQVDENPGQYEGKGMAVAGLVMSITGGVLGLTLQGIWFRTWLW